MTQETQDDLTAALAVLRPEIRQMLAEDLPVDAQRSQEAFSAQRWAQLREQVHRIKGSASFCQLEALKRICVLIEDRLAAESLPDSGSMSALAHEVDRVVTALSS